jgi:site-specific DNA recombinase
MKQTSSSFHKFGKTSPNGPRVQGERSVIYTRVSTKEQADNNLSLATQKKACENFALKNKYEVVAYFGGTYESAKTDERKEFNKMLQFVRRSKERISYIIVYSVDRFSRSGANAIYITSELKKQGITVQAVGSPIDTNTASGSLQQNIQFIFSEYDNQMRREKCMAGTREKLLRGDWVTKAPMGYDNITKNGQKMIVVNDVGRLLSRAFEMKAFERLTNVEIAQRLNNLGLKIYKQKLTDIFRNPFYCGMLSHSALDGKIIDGNHEKLVSKELFLLVSEIQSENNQGYQVSVTDENLPLKRFIKCDTCGTYMRGYKVKKFHYYKCGTIGCNNNIKASWLHDFFPQMLAPFNVDPKYFDILKAQLKETFFSVNKLKIEDTALLESQLKDIDIKLIKLEERYIEENFSKDLFEKFRKKYLEERIQVEKQLEKESGSNLTGSNLTNYISTALAIASKLGNLWANSDFSLRQKLQHLVFPEGIFFNKRTLGCRTGRINSVFSAINSLTNNSGPKNNSRTSGDTNSADLVAGARLELTTFGL